MGDTLFYHQMDANNTVDHSSVNIALRLLYLTHRGAAFSSNDDDDDDTRTQ